MNLYTEALMFAAEAHDGQQRKYTGEPYIAHPIAVAEIVRGIHGTDEMIAAALLHDTVEDCGVPLEVISWKFGQHVATLVGWLTDISLPSDGNRVARKAIDRDHLARASQGAQTIKVADLIDNTRSIVAHDPKFAVTYLGEKLALLDVLERANPALRAKAYLMAKTSIGMVSHA